jgi:small-conductance mechanosensitive channel
LGLFSYLLINRGIDSIRRRDYISRATQGTLKVLVRWVVLVLVFLVLLQQLGVQLASVWTALSAVVLFVGVGLVAVWSVASNAFCALLLLTFRPFSIGDKIEILEPTGGAALGGKVVNLNLLYTYLLEKGSNGSKGNILQIPNNIFFQKSIRRQRGIRTRKLENFIFKDDAESIRQNTAIG